MDSGPRLPAANVVLGIRRLRRTYRPAGERLFSASDPPGINGMLPDPRLGRQPITGKAGCRPRSCRGLYDPPEGFVASANENINPPGGPQLVTQPVPDYRRRRIDERLAELPSATVQDMQHLQYDVISMQARDLLAVFLPHLPEGPIKERLKAWDCGYGPESLEATLFSAIISQRAAGSLRPGSEQARRLGLAADVLSLLARRLFDDGRNLHRSFAEEGSTRSGGETETKRR